VAGALTNSVPHHRKKLKEGGHRGEIRFERGNLSPPERGKKGGIGTHGTTAKCRGRRFNWKVMLSLLIIGENGRDERDYLHKHGEGSFLKNL